MKFLLYLAILPSVIIGYLIYRSDKREKEPILELIKALFFGVLSAVLAISFGYILGTNRIETTQLSTLKGAFLYAFFGVALVEEICKWGCTSILLRKNKNYNYLFDGIVYSVFVSLGFATIENIIYTLAGGISTALVRGVLTVPAHAFFGVFMGYYISFAKSEHIRENKQACYFFLGLSIVIPIVLHGLFDFLLLAQKPILLVVFLIFVILLYIFSIRQIRMLAKQERPFLQKKFCSQCGNQLTGSYCSQCGKKEETKEDTSI
ncbi:MAG: PrsW family intramembrane metalloprotease [Bacilli bacterium]|nr:PrsW family intramembrane metalloprotease [Bacilli bacterium]